MRSCFDLARSCSLKGGFRLSSFGLSAGVAGGRPRSLSTRLRACRIAASSSSRFAVSPSSLSACRISVRQSLKGRPWLRAPHTFFKMSNASGARAWGVLSGWMTARNITYHNQRVLFKAVHIMFWRGMRSRRESRHGCSQRESCRYFFFTISGVAVSSKSRMSYGLGRYQKRAHS